MKALLVVIIVLLVAILALIVIGPENVRMQVWWMTKSSTDQVMIKSDCLLASLGSRGVGGTDLSVCPWVLAHTD